MVAAGYSSNQARADELRQSVEAEGGTCTLHQGNIGDAEDCQRVVQEVIEQHGRLDILVNNAGHHGRQAGVEAVARPIGTRC